MIPKDSNTIQKRKIELKEYYDGSKFDIFQTGDCENVTGIDFQNEIVYYYEYVTDSCGCCSTTEDKETNLDSFLEFLSDDDYEELLNDLKCFHSI